MGLDQCCPKEGRVTLRVHPMLLQQEKPHFRGREQIDYLVLQEGAQGLVLDPQAHHEEPQDGRTDVGYRRQVHPSRGGDPRHQRASEGLRPHGPA
jgi:hypothetical protein